MNASVSAQADEEQVRNVLQQWASNTREGRLEDVLLNHAPNVLIYDVLEPLKYEGAAAYRKSWGDWHPNTPSDGKFELGDLRVRTGSEVAFAHGIIQCGGVLPSGQTFEDVVRATFCLAKEADGWVVVHQHISKPISLKGST